MSPGKPQAEEAKGKCLLSEERKASAYTEFWGSIPETEPYRVLFGNIRDRLYYTRWVHLLFRDPTGCPNPLLSVVSHLC